MTRRLGLMALVVAAVSAPPAEAKDIRGYVSCGISDSSYRTPPSHSCPVGDLPQAVIVNRKRSSVRYRLCVQVPSDRRTARRTARAAVAGSTSAD